MERSEKEFKKENKNGGSLAHLPALVAFIFLPSPQLPPPLGPAETPHRLSIPLLFTVYFTAFFRSSSLPELTFSPRLSVLLCLSYTSSLKSLAALPLQ